ncbi:nucleotide disphospho-sugar-binding domain-containing protein [Streptomyces sp. NPDC088116]|uniref:nucleotide disphospho-sugar-binding domain-containing protein n=1 Tax=Streptomyces sp. NPDC088116 TaxID=3365825 RepID=UPI0037FD011C
MRVLFTTAPLAGHLFPLVPMAWALRAAGHEVLMATRDNFVPVALRTGLPVASCGPAAEFADLVDDEPGSLPEGMNGKRYVHGRALARIAGGSLAGVRKLADSWQPDLIVSERAESAGPLAAMTLGVPWVRYHWSVSDLPEYQYAADEEFAPELASLGVAGFARPARVFDPWPECLRLSHAADHDGIRHVPANGEAPMPDWLSVRGDRPRICVTLGTLLPRYGETGTPDFMVDLVRELAGLDVELLIAVDDDIAAGWPPLPSAVLHAGRLPLADVLPTCDAVVHHGGQGTALTAVLAGRPQLITPRFDDQFDNAQALSASGAALLSPPLADPAAVAAGCGELLENALYAKAAARLADEVALLPSPSVAVAALEQLPVAGGVV